MPDELWIAAQETIGRRADACGPRAYRGERVRRYMLAGVLRCESCGYSFCADGPGGFFSCSGRRQRGACEVALRVPHREMADRLLAAIEREILDETRIAYVVEKAEALVMEALEQGDRRGDEDRLRVVERTIRRKGELYADEDDELAAARLRGQLKDLRGERQQLRDRFAVAAGGPQLDQAAIRARLEEITRDLRSSLSDDAAEAREAVLALLAEDENGRRRLDVRADPEAPGGYMIEGDWVVDLPVNEETPAEAGSNRRPEGW